MKAFASTLGVAVAAAALVAATGLGAAWAQAAAQPWTAPPEAKKLKNPVKGIGNAKKTVETNCASCHGASGKGDGVAAAALTPKPADWTSARVQKETDGELFWKITNGRGPMPPWKHLPEKDRWEIINYIRTLKK
jgi:mono/diheme cytochrome c family protein